MADSPPKVPAAICESKLAKVENKKYFFISGLPRTGSTLMCNLLMQRPDAHCTGTSPIIDTLLLIRNSWADNPAYRAMPRDESDEIIKRVMRGAFKGYFDHINKPFIFDKSRAWTGYLEMAEMLLGERPKIIVMVRDLRDICASFEKEFRYSADTRVNMQRVINDPNAAGGQRMIGSTAFERLVEMMSPNGMVQYPATMVRDAIVRGWRNDMLFVEYKDFTGNPHRVMNEVYRFLEMEPFKHNIEDVKQVLQEDDFVWGFKGLHDIKKKIVAPMKDSGWQQVYSGGMLKEPFWTQMCDSKLHSFWKHTEE